MAKFSTGDVKEGDLEGSFNLPRPGMHHVMVTDVTDSDDGDFVTAEFTVLVGEDNGKSVRQRLYLTGKTDKATKTLTNRLVKIAYALGLVEKSQLDGRAMNLDTSLFVNRTCVVKIAESEYTKDDGSKGKRTEIEFFGFWRPNDPAVDGVAKDTRLMTPTANAASTSQPVAATSSSNYDDV